MSAPVSARTTTVSVGSGQVWIGDPCALLAWVEKRIADGLTVEDVRCEFLKDALGGEAAGGVSVYLDTESHYCQDPQGIPVQIHEKSDGSVSVKRTR